jgi:hypothetical protein
MHRVTNASERRCRAKTKAGGPCRAHVVNAAGYCVAHDPEKPMDMRALGRKSGEARRRPNPERVHQNLRQYLRENVEPAEVWAALKLAMEGQNESARVAASRVLIDALHEPHQDEDRTQQAARAGAAAKERLAELLNRRARAHDVRQVRDALDELAAELSQQAVDEHPDLSSVVVGSEKARAIIRGLEEIGLVVPRGRLEELAEARALELLASLKAEHGIPA